VYSGKKTNAKFAKKRGIFPFRPPCYIHIPTQNFLVVLGTYDVLRNKTPPHQQDDEGASLVDYIKPMGPR